LTEHRLKEVLRLPTSTAKADVGPILEYRADWLWVTYDATDATGEIVWTTILFRDATAVKFTPEQGCTPTMVEARSRVCEFEFSDWKRAIQEANPRYELPASTRHFVLYFDDRGCLEVLAAEVSVDWPRRGLETGRLSFSREDIITILSDLNMMVSSLDRLGTAAAFDSEHDAERVRDFVDRWRVTQRLARIRHLLSEPFPLTLGSDDMDDLERLMQGVPHWTESHPDPPPSWQADVTPGSQLES
jgi:hypothetical protein